MNNSINLFKPLPLSASTRERLAIADTLSSLYELSDSPASTITERAEDRADISQILVSLIEYSEFEQAHRSCRTVFRQLLRRPEFMQLAGPFGLGEEDFFLLTQDGKLLQIEITDDAVPRFEFADVTDTVTHAIADSRDTLKQLSTVTKLTGGVISSSHYIPLNNWLSFHQLEIPENIQGIADLVNFLKLQLPDPSSHGNYWGVSNADGEPELAISSDHYAVVRQCIAQSVGNKGSTPQTLLDYLADALIERHSLSRAFLQEDPEASWALLVDTPQAEAFALACVHAMNPQASAAQSNLTHHQRSALLVAAILLDFGLADASKRHFYHSFHVYAPRHVQATRNEIIEEFTDIVVNSYGVQPSSAPLALQLIFAGLAPEFLVVTPPNLQLGSCGWVMLRKSVLLAESVAPGLSRRMTYESLKTLGATAPVSPAQRALHDVIMTRCILDWHAINGLEPDATEDLPTQVLVEQALARYNTFQGQMSEALKNIATPPVSRRALARTAIEGVGLNPEASIRDVSGQAESLLDVYLARRLSAYNNDWTERLQRLEPANTLYAREIDRQYLLHQTGVATLTRLALMQSQVADRVAIEQGHLALYRVIRVRPIRSEGLIRSEADVIAPYGVVMLSKINDDIRAYELFPLLGVCRENQALIPQFNERSLWQEDATQFRSDIVLHEASMDPAYFNGKALDSRANPQPHDFVLERFAQFEKADVIRYQRSPMQSFASPRFQAIAEQVVKHNPPLPYNAFYAMGYDKTAIEASNERWEQAFETILNIIIPFKECVEGLASGRQDRRSSALFGCVMDATLLLFAFVGAAGTFAKALNSSARLLDLSKVGGRFVLSLFNPLDGVPQLLQGGAKLLGKGAFKLGHYGLSVTQLGAGQLRRLTHSSSGSYDLVKALSKTGAAAEIRMTLPTVAHARALFKDDTLETFEHVLARLGETTSIPKGTSSIELEHLFSHAILDTSRALPNAQQLQKLIGSEALDDLFKTIMSKNYIDFATARSAVNADYPQLLDAVAALEARNVTYMKHHQENLLRVDLGSAPYDGVLPELRYNQQGFTDNAQRAGAWIVHASNSPGNDLDSIVAILREYAASNKVLTDPALIRELHVSIAPATADVVRVGTSDKKYASSISGFAVMQEHLKKLDVAHEHFSKQLLGTVVGFHGFGDGNGRTGRALYAISELRRNRFDPLSKEAFSALHGLD
ncbi:hypothetical protein [Pseudomonas koreensis]|uniref:hypothetical protein n=1 Tax=Pseudomonas koreensis TaxID=198620 RepID=UPI003D973D72